MIEKRGTTRSEGVATPAAASQYLSSLEVCQRTPWSVDAVQKMIHRGVLRRGIHFFQPAGRRTRLFFSWPALRALIEGQAIPPGPEPVLVEQRPAKNQAAPPRRMIIDVQKATTDLQRLLD